MSPPEFSLIVPTYNEAQNIVEFLETAHGALGDISHEILVVDDNSPDETWRIVQEFSIRNPWARILRRTDERGLSSAVIRGWENARGEILGVMDADMSHDENILPLLIQKVRGGVDLACGSRRVRGGGATHWPWYRRMTSGVATQLAKTLLNLKLSDPMSGFFVLKRALFESCRATLYPQGYKILLELYCKSRPRQIADVPFIFKDRKQGYSKLTGKVMTDYLGMVLRLRKETMR